MRFRFAKAASVATLVALYTATPALANGRFPRAQVVQPVPRGDGQTVYVRATFGLLVSHDALAAEARWSWLCEAAMGYQGEWDPPLTVTMDGRVWLGMATGLHVLSDGGCGASDVPDLAGELVTDLTNSPDDAWPILAVSSQEAEGDQPARPGRIWRTKDGKHFDKLGPGLPNVHFDTVEIAPSRPSRLYASGYLPGEASPVHFWRSDDGGATLTAIDPKVPRPGRLYIGAVDPQDPERVLVRLLDENGSDILVSKDGGKSFVSTLHFATSNYGFAMTRDGKTCVAASSAAKDGVFVSHDRGQTWTHGAAIGAFGMRFDDRGTLWALSNAYAPGGFFAGSSTDDGAHFTGHGTFSDVEGALGCDAGAALACPAAWEATRTVIAGASLVPTPAASVSASAVAAASAGSGPTVNVGDAEGNVVGGSGGSRSTCGCSVVGAPELNVSHAIRAGGFNVGGLGGVNVSRGPRDRSAIFVLSLAVVAVIVRRARRRRD